MTTPSSTRGDSRPLPLVTDRTAFYWSSGMDGVLRIQRCLDCHAYVHPPGEVCIYCRSDALEVTPVSGRGVVVALTINHQPSHPALDPPYLVAVVALEEDPRVCLTTNLVDCDAGEVDVGTSVEVRFQQVEDVWIPLFSPVPGDLVPLPASIDPSDVARQVRPMASMDKFENKVAISGIGMSRLGRRLMVDPVALTIEACRAAVADAGLEFDDIDGLCTYPAGSGTDGFSEGGIAAIEGALRIRPTWHNGGIAMSGAGGSLVTAMLAVSAGLCRHVLCFRTVWQSSHAELVRTGRWPATPRGRQSEWGAWFAPYGAGPVNIVAMAASEHFRRYGTTRETLGWIAINNRANAQVNPTAIFRDPMTMDDYMSARPVSTPLSLYDLDPLCDASTAVIVSARDAAKDLRRPLIAVEAVGTQIIERLEWDQGVRSHAPGILGPAAHLWSRTSLRPEDVDVAEIYDGFSFLCLTWIEALGFCGIGEAKSFLEGGVNIARDGLLPLNTHGGQLSHGRTHGMGMVYEAVTQLRHDGGERQIPDAKVAIATNGGISPSTAILLTTL